MYSRYNARAEPSVRVSRMATSITEAQIRKTMQNLGCISEIVIKARESSSGLPHNRVTIHFEYWFENATSDRLRDELCEGKELSIMFVQHRYFTGSAVFNEQSEKKQEKPEKPEKKKQEKEKVKDDSRPYHVRRTDDALCNQDVSQGFIDRRIAKETKKEKKPETKKEKKVVAPDYSKEYRTKKDVVKIDMSTPALHIACGLPDMPVKSVAKPRVKRVVAAQVAAQVVAQVAAQVATGIPDKIVSNKPLVRNVDMVIRMQHAFRCEITDDIYRNNVQNVRDQREFERERDLDYYVDRLDRMDDTFDYRDASHRMPTRKPSRVVSE